MRFACFRAQSGSVATTVVLSNRGGHRRQYGRLHRRQCAPLPEPRLECWRPTVSWISASAARTAASIPARSPPTVEIRRRATTLDGVYARQMFPKVLGLGRMGEPAAPARVFGEFVTTNYFTILGARPAAGRLFGPADAEALGASPVVVLSHAYWHGQFNGDATVVGRSVRLNGYPFTVIGIAPNGFQGTGVLSPISGSP